MSVCNKCTADVQQWHNPAKHEHHSIQQRENNLQHKLTENRTENLAHWALSVLNRIRTKPILWRLIVLRSIFDLLFEKKRKIKAKNNKNVWGKIKAEPCHMQLKCVACKVTQITVWYACDFSFCALVCCHSSCMSKIGSATDVCQKGQSMMMSQMHTHSEVRWICQSTEAIELPKAEAEEQANSKPTVAGMQR